MVCRVGNATNTASAIATSNRPPSQRLSRRADRNRRPIAARYSAPTSRETSIPWSGWRQMFIPRQDHAAPARRPPAPVTNRPQRGAERERHQDQQHHGTKMTGIDVTQQRSLPSVDQPADQGRRGAEFQFAEQPIGGRDRQRPAEWIVDGEKQPDGQVGEQGGRGQRHRRVGEPEPVIVIDKSLRRELKPLEPIIGGRDVVGEGNHVAGGEEVTEPQLKQQRAAHGTDQGPSLPQSHAAL